jgi:hypothetical protein
MIIQDYVKSGFASKSTSNHKTNKDAGDDRCFSGYAE